MTQPYEVSESVRTLAVLFVFGERGLQAGGSLPVATLEREWRRTGLRHADLLFALDRLEHLGWLLLDEQDSGTVAVLTSAGHAQLSQVPVSPGAQRERLRAMATLLHVSHRRPGELPGFGRRAGDARPPFTSRGFGAAVH